MQLGLRNILRICFTVVCLAAATATAREGSVRQHIVVAGETLYSIAQRYQVPIPVIQAANPTLQGTTLSIGMVLVIPAASAAQDETPKVDAATQPEPQVDAKEQRRQEKAERKRRKEEERRERREQQQRAIVFGGSRRAADTTVVQPAASTSVATPVVGQTVHTEVEEELAESPWTVSDAAVNRDGVSSIAVILPFNLDAATVEAETHQRRAVEFYEGLLIAVDEAQAAGQRIEVQAYDLGTQSIVDVLHTPSLARADVIVAPKELRDVQPIVDFGQTNGIAVVSPLAYLPTVGADNNTLYQLTPPKSDFYPQLSDELLSRFAGREFVFLTDSSEMAEVETLVPYLQGRLADSGVAYHTYSYRDPSSLSRLDSVLHLDGRPMFIVPVTSSEAAMRRMFPCLMPLVAADDSTTTCDVTVLGYPKWISLTDEFAGYYYDLDVHIFTKFYASPFDADVTAFYQTFKRWYGKEPMPIYPRYALLGYDVGRYFLAALRADESSLASGGPLPEVATLQNPFGFERIAEGGYSNRRLYLVHFTPSAQIEKYEVR